MINWSSLPYGDGIPSSEIPGIGRSTSIRFPLHRFLTETGRTILACLFQLILTALSAWMAYLSPNVQDHSLSFRNYPLSLLKSDTVLVLRWLYLLPLVFVPIPKLPGLPFWQSLRRFGRISFAGFEQVTLALASVISIFGTVATSLLWGAWAVAFISLSIAFFYTAQRIFQNNLVIKSSVPVNTRGDHSNEEWVSFSMSLRSERLVI